MMIIDDIKAIIQDLESEQQMPPINVELVDNELAMIFENTNRAGVSNRNWALLCRDAKCPVFLGVFWF